MAERSGRPRNRTKGRESALEERALQDETHGTRPKLSFPNALASFLSLLSPPLTAGCEAEKGAREEEGEGAWGWCGWHCC